MYLSRNAKYSSVLSDKTSEAVYLRLSVAYYSQESSERNFKKYLQEDFLVDFLFFSTCRSSKTALHSSIPKVPKYPKYFFPGQNFRQGCPSVDLEPPDFLFKSLLHLLTILLLCKLLHALLWLQGRISAP